MDVGATNTTKEQKSMSILEMMSSRNEHQKLLLHDELQYKNIHNVLAPYFPLKNTAPEVVKFPLTQLTFVECLLCAGDCVKHWGYNRGKQNKDLGSSEPIGRGPHSVRNTKKFKVGNGKNFVCT